MFGSVQALLSASADKPLWQAVLDDDCQDRDVPAGNSLTKMAALWRTMKGSVLDYDPTRRSPCGLSGGQGAQMAALDHSICGPFIQEVISTALKLGEHNACMGRIVAAPTAGACGVLPAVLIPLQRRERLTDDQMVQCLYVSAGFGQVIATRASISGAECGCQAEIGSACSMASAALAELFEMGLGQIEYAAEVAMEHHLGLTCDPIAGLVQIPCIERNAVAAMRAINALSLANFLADTRKISFDTVIKAMYNTGKDLLNSYRETSSGGLAKYYEIK